MASYPASLIQTYHFLVERELSREELVEVLPALRGYTRRFSLLYPKGVTLSRATRAMLDFIVKRSKRDTERR